MTRAIYYSCLWRSTGEGIRPLTITRRRPRITTNSYQCSSAAPSHIGATRRNHSSNSSKCTCNRSQSHYDDESMMEMSGRCLLRLIRMSTMSKCQESEPRASQILFIEPLKQIEPLESREGALRTDRTWQSR